MLALDDMRWGELSHAYGKAADIPDMLRALAKAVHPVGPDVEPWFGMWSSLCHQGDVYSASYAAVPHIVQLAIDNTQPIDFGFFQLPAAVEIARQDGRGPEVPKFLSESYFAAIIRLAEAVKLHGDEDWSQDTLLCAAAAQAVSKGHYKTAQAILNLDDYWINRIANCDFD